MDKQKGRSKLIQYSLVAVIAAILTFPSMMLVKNAPNSSLMTGWDFLGVALLIFAAWFVVVGICTWFVKYVTGSRELKKNPQNEYAKKIVAEEKKNLGRLGKVVKWLIIIGVVYYVIVFTVMAIVFGSMAIH